MKNKNVVITGGTDGIGRIAAREMAKAGASVTVVGRNAEKGARVVAELKEAAGHDRLHFVQADLALNAGVRAAAQSLRSRLDRIDVLLNNAGAIFQRRELTEEGI